MSDAISVQSDEDELLMMPQIESNLESGTELYSDLDSTAATDSEFISTLWNKVKGGAKSAISKA